MTAAGYPSISAGTKLCAVIGNPVLHSLSPAMHNAAFQAAGLDYVYLAFTVSDLPGCLAGLKACEGFQGLSVTIPHKVAIMPCLDCIDEEARQVGCVNTVVKEKGQLRGAVTDGVGALRAIENSGVDLKGKTILFAGTGGAARAVAFALSASGLPREIIILGRTAEKVDLLAGDLAQFGTTKVNGGLLQEELITRARTSDLLINATPLGMYGVDENKNSFPGVSLEKGQTVFDMVYRPEKTPFVQEALRSGCTIVPGLDMLLYQAVVQFELWTGCQAPESVMRDALKRALDN